MEKKISEMFLELSEKAKALEKKGQDSKQITQQKIDNWVKEGKAKSDESKAEFKVKSENLKSDMKSHWQKVQDNFNNHVTEAKNDFNNLKHSVKAADAEMYANWSEDEAKMSVAFALNSLSNAEIAISEAMEARFKADKLK